MEKLIELLNEYEREKGLKNGIHIYWKIGPHGELLHGATAGAGYSELKLISKKYGFIQWLVDNDKIEIQNNCAYNTDGDYEKREIKSDYESLLMLLSIQDFPIEFLISILK